jgi:hypothetical protein
MISGQEVMAEPNWLRIAADAATVAAALAAWWSAKAARDAAVEARQSTFDGFLPVLKVEHLSKDSVGFRIALSNIGKGPLLDLASEGLNPPCKFPRIDIDQQRREFLLPVTSAWETTGAVFRYSDLFGRRFLTKVVWKVHATGIDFQSSLQTKE